AVAAAMGAELDVVALLREAVDGRVLRLLADESYWFVHPLLAEVLVDGLLPEERRAIHAAFATTLARAAAGPASPGGDAAAQMAADLGGDGRRAAEWAVELADHHDRAGLVADAYRLTLRAADLVGRVDGGAETVRLLRRAVELRRQVPDAAESE